ncbi:MAG: response regulator [Chitinophagaceae bacterium]|nr:response regulator [Anaerolineae bacterium]
MYLKGKNIFIVEDNLSNSTIMKVILQASGAKVFHDRTTIDTVARMKEAGHVDLVIMDLMLSNGLTGYDVFEKLKADPQLCTIPAIVVSASDPALEMNKARTKGFAGYIAKPINNYTFAKHIAAVLDGQQIWGDD